MAEAAPGHSGTATPAVGSLAWQQSQAAAGSTLQNDFTSAAAEFHVPVSVLLAVSYQETLWESHSGKPSVTGNYNVMGLTDVNASDLAPRTTAGESDEINGSGEAQHTSRTSAALLAEQGAVNTSLPSLHTLDAAAALLHQPTSALKSSMLQSIRGGAALLASYERKVHGSGALPTGAEDWAGAVAAYDQTSNATTAQTFVDRVYGSIRTGERRTTADNQLVALAASPATTVPELTTAVSRQALVSSAATGLTSSTAACPQAPAATVLACSYIPAAYASNSKTDPTDYGNYDKANRPTDGDAITYVVIHDTESTTASAVAAFQNPADYASANYIISTDGSVIQMVPDTDVAWSDGNKYINSHSVNVEHEGYGLQTGSWYTEQEYESSALLVRYLTAKYDIPVDRSHIIGHDDVPGPLDSYVAGMHWDPGPYWDWNQYMTLVGGALSGNGQAVVGGTVTIDPPYTTATAQPLTGCGSSTAVCAAHATNFVYLYKGPSTTSGYITDSLAGASSTLGWDWSDKADVGQTFVVDKIQGDWVAIWYGGQQAWFYDPGGRYAMANPTLGTGESVITPIGSSSVQVYGAAYPETSAYPAAIQSQAKALTPLSYTIQPGQAYVANAVVDGDYDYTQNYNCTAVDDCTVVIGKTQYYPIRFNHRLAFVLASAMEQIVPNTPPSGTYVTDGPTRILDTRSGVGAPKATVGAGKSISLQITGANGVPASGVTAVVLNVTATNATNTSNVTAYPDGTTRPGVSNLNFTKNETIPNLVVVPVGTDGKVDLYNAFGSVNLIADLSGYYSSSGTGSVFHTAGPVRVMDTRYGTGVRLGAVGPHATVTLQVGAANGVPLKATAVVLNVTATGPTSSGVVTVYPNGETLPTVSNLNFTKGETIPNLVIVPIVNGKINFTNGGGSVQLIADLAGYYAAG